YSISPGKGRAWILIAPESIRRAKSRLREITGRSKGRSLEQIIGKLRVYLTGWRNYYSLNEGSKHRRRQLLILSAYPSRRALGVHEESEHYPGTKWQIK
ncbi:MAG: hypothetical protein G5703_08610, partial [Serratia symbiotica]|nr:hypothetical protein [Serratia symbiotica]